MLDDASPSAQVQASVTYNMIVEGVLAETGYHALYSMLEENDLMPGQHRGLLIPAVGVIGDAFACYDPVPFGLVEDVFIEYARDQFSKRFARLEKARGSSLEEIESVTRQVIENTYFDNVNLARNSENWGWQGCGAALRATPNFRASRL